MRWIFLPSRTLFFNLLTEGGYMRAWKIVGTVLILSVMPLRAKAQASSIDQVVDRIVTQEKAEMQMLRQYSPLVETYIQMMRPDPNLGRVPAGDKYFLGKAQLANGVDLEGFAADKGGVRHKLSGLGNGFTVEFLSRVFLQMIYLDTNGFDQQHYRFDYVRREFLGEVRCFVFDVSPLEEKGGDHFLGRIWVEDQDYTIVRFNGTNSSAEHSKAYRLHCDSWRMNVVPRVWVPAYIYSAESEAGNKLSNNILFQAQTLFWGYGPNNSTAEYSSTAESQAAPGPENEEVGLDRLQAAGLLAQTGSVDKVLYTIANNLAVSNNLDIEPDVACRVLLTTTLESFTVGHTILVSRGLLDVLPDEASLAMILAHELAHIALGHRIDTKYAFGDRMLFEDPEAFQKVNLKRDDKEEIDADKKAIELLKNSPYKDKLGSAGLFLKALQQKAPELPSLIRPHLGNSR